MIIGESIDDIAEWRKRVKCHTHISFSHLKGLPGSLFVMEVAKISWLGHYAFSQRICSYLTFTKVLHISCHIYKSWPLELMVRGKL